MKVNLAAQVFSKSTATSIKDCREDGFDVRFLHSEPTCHLLEQVKLFDNQFKILISQLNNF